MKHIVLIAFLCIQVPFIALSQSTNRPPDRMKMLNAFNGEWKGEMVTMAGKKKIKYKLTHTSEKIAGGWGVQLTEMAVIPEKGKYLAARIFSYSSSGDTTFMYTVDNLGQTWFYTGTWESPKRLLMHSTLNVGGKKTDKSISYIFVSPKEYDYKSITKTEGEPDEIVEMKMLKQ